MQTQFLIRTSQGNHGSDGDFGKLNQAHSSKEDNTWATVVIYNFESVELDHLLLQKNPEIQKLTINLPGFKQNFHVEN